MIVVTGGAGFIGSWIVSELNQKGITEILVVDRLRDQDKYQNLIGLQFEDFMDKDEFLRRIERDSIHPKIMVATVSCRSMMRSCNHSSG